MIQTEYEFTLPRGYLDSEGQLHRQGRMRLATALDEIEPAQDPRVLANESYLPVLLLSRVITQLEGIPKITPVVVEKLFASDLAYLQDLYLRLNSPENMVLSTVCPNCQHRFRIRVAPLGVNDHAG
jgi:hypothetical protein